ncbi:MAG: N-acetyl-gamma-glutamyl-phosphate reductase [Dehalococcoidia bacterium]|nr:N-acetyl-gamma-glutamyl-phosphate reductase [Dehalococcoidia bacterium]
MAKVKVGIINVTGYAGSELARLLHQHPKVSLVSVTGRSNVGQGLGQVFPHLTGLGLTLEKELGDVDVAFSALPHKASAGEVLPLLEKGVKVVDISADFRLKDPALYRRWYDFQHPSLPWLRKAVYGLPELHRSQLASAQLIANPGCYPVSAILALAPALREGLIEPDVIVDSKSGISGAGRTLGLNVHFAEANESVCAYSLEGHRHLPEIVQELETQRPGESLALTFVPHLVPMTRGILSSCYARLVKGKLSPDEKGMDELRQLYKDFYRGEPFTRVVEVPPQTKHTLGSNLCLIYPTLDLRTGRLVVISCLDNLVRGAAGQAIQNMNLMLGYPETTGLEGIAVYP